MLVAVDIGNTNITVGLMKESTVLKSFKIPTDFLRQPPKAADVLKREISAFARKEVMESVYVCSVVPDLNKEIRGVFKSCFEKQIVIVGVDVVVPVINRYRIPAQVGADRLVNVYAGLKLYGPGLIIVDFGTAITFDIVSKKSEYLGGLIVPGLKLMQEALHKKTALLPYVELAKPIEIVGKDTVSSIRAGIVYGVAGIYDSILGKLLLKECKGFKIISTGGDGALIEHYVAHRAIYEDFLILKGLALVHKSQSVSK